MIIPVNSLSSQGGGGSPSIIVDEIDSYPTEGGTVSIPDSNALIINLILWPDTALNQVTVNLPPTKPGRRVFIYADKAILQVDLVSTDPVVIVRSGSILMNQFDQAVFNTVSQTIWARVATS